MNKQTQAQNLPRLRINWNQNPGQGGGDMLKEVKNIHCGWCWVNG